MKLLKEELYILTDALIHYNRVDKSLNPSTKDKIKTIQKKLLLMEEINA